jgi:hypothetical protein
MGISISNPDLFKAILSWMLTTVVTTPGLATL